jgi:hypothetical protein
MLFKEVHLKGIQGGTISLAFRKWDKASVKKGTLLKTPIGLVEIVDITTMDEDKITANDVLNAGFESKGKLLQSLRQNHSANIYKIEVRYHSADPRIELREQNLTNEKYAVLKEKLMRLDKYSKQGDWTRTVLLIIKDNPHLHTIGIARLTGFEKEWLKLNIRKLKNLGLTISHNVGYELSPLGKTFVGKLLK